MSIRQDILKNFRSKNILVTGGTGMIGRQVVDLLASAGANLRLVSLDRIRVDAIAEHIYGDLRDFGFCKQICQDMDYVFHIAGIGASVKSAKTRIASHLVPMLQMNTNMLEACRLAKVHKAVFTSSVGAYAACPESAERDAEVFREADYRIDSIPMDFAGWAKRMAEAQVYAYKVEHGLAHFAVVRPPNVYGPGDNFHPDHALVIPSLMYRIHQGENPLVVWGDGTCERDFVYSRDVAEGTILALWFGTNNPAGFVNLGSGRVYTVQELVETLRSFLDFEYRFDPSRPTGVKRRFLDITLARQTLGYNPTTRLEEGLKKTWQWFVEHPEEHTQKVCYFENEESKSQKQEVRSKKQEVGSALAHADSLKLNPGAPGSPAKSE